MSLDDDFASITAYIPVKNTNTKLMRLHGSAPRTTVPQSKRAVELGTTL
jgi:hypothetical protein